MRALVVSGLALLALTGLPAAAQNFDPNILNQMRVPNAQIALQQAGYSKARSVNLSGKQWDLYQSGGACVGFTSMYGTVSEARGFQTTDCNPAPPPRPPSSGGGNNSGRPDLDLATLKNQRVNSAQSTLGANGYAKVRSMDVNGQQWDLWRATGFNRRCVGFTSMYGTVTDARQFQERDCNDGGGGNNNPGRPGNNWRDFDLASLQGLRVDNAQNRLRQAGYVLVRNSTIDGRRWDLWQNDNYRNSCIGFSSFNGTVEETDSFSVSRCGGAGQGNSGPGYGQARPDFNTSQLRDIAVTNAQSRLSNNGYEFARQLTIDGSRWDLWYNDRYRNACVGFNSFYGEVSAVRNFEGDLCRNGLR